jgi:hypothetical protein
MAVLSRPERGRSEMQATHMRASIGIVQEGRAKRLDRLAARIARTATIIRHRRLLRLPIAVEDLVHPSALV